ncbi:HDOD domain-containing protein [Allochromatium vinosum]|uniref:Signal transduction protein n=1 Tax=Allochromatium vinosum (strain ATCC 17899 / DSM 180 / NBRC 103801 / NCIMB 10441 / D) TaxID=572477 RepID=D3RV58_ALLVD|nr:HDOD domain-containing protein [Allochromatium vinosum]ADC62990.1 putative signal transduction protein [Allochromatium vinosum DSM 180]
MTPTKASGLEAWLDVVRDQKMPIFEQTVHQILSISEDDLAPASALASVVLQDASLTTRLLKLANSIAYNPSTTAISTVTRAVIVLGFDAVRDMCLTLTLVDTLLQGPARVRLERELARAMHAATQARALATARGDKSPEEVFIATLLYRVGELAFWCFGNESCERVEQLAAQPGVTLETALERVLGFRLSQLSRRLVHEWRLTDLLKEAIDHPARQDPRIQTVMLGHQIARCAEEHGWHSEEMERLERRAARLIDASETDIRALLQEKAAAAFGMAHDCGASAAARLIPLPDGYGHLVDELEAAEAEPDTPQVGATPPPASHPLPDSRLQLSILRELNAAIESVRCDFNVIMELVLEGLYRGVGLDRVIFALMTPDRRGLKAKYALGLPDELTIAAFQFARPASGTNILFETLDHQLPRLVTLAERERDPRLVPEGLVGLMGIMPFMVAPILINQQSIGLFLADRGLSQRPLDPESFEDFKHFVQQANMGLTLAQSRQRRR